jgi:phage/plasmid primase-like uncharacterized protein
MYNPLIGSLKKITDTVLNEKIQDLRKKYYQTTNPAMQQQIAATLNNYQEESARRQAEMFKKSKETDNEDLDGLINIS